MFAADPLTAADELLRVCRPGGSIGLANSTMTGDNQLEDEVIGNYFPGDPDDPPNPWTRPEGIADLLEDGIADLRVQPRSVVYRFPSIESNVETVFDEFGPRAKMVATLSFRDRERLKSDLMTGLESFNQSGDATMALPFDHVEVTGTVSG